MEFRVAHETWLARHPVGSRPDGFRIESVWVSAQRRSTRALFRSRPRTVPHAQTCWRCASVFLRTIQQPEQRCDGLTVRDGISTYSMPASTALYRSSARNALGAVERISRFSPAFWATLRPGCLIVPFALRVMFATVSDSVAIRFAVATIFVDC